LTVAQLMIEQPGEARVPALSEARRHPRRVLFFRVVIDVEVIGLQDLEVELLVLNLVATEVGTLCRCPKRNRQDDECENKKGCREADWQSHGNSYYPGSRGSAAETHPPLAGTLASNTQSAATD